MSIIATGSKTIIDLSDGKSLSAYLGANQPRTQIHDVNAGTYSPNWETVEGRLVITPVVYANQDRIDLSDTHLSITWKRKEGSGSETALVDGETVSGNVLTVSNNKLSTVTSGQLTYIAYVTYTDPDTSLPINAMADINFSALTTGEDAKNAWITGEQVFKYDTGGIASPAQITLTGNLQNVTMDKWKYKNASGSWVDYPSTSDNANITTQTLVVKPTHDIWVNDVASIMLTTSDAAISDTISMYKVHDGSQGGTGENACVVFLTNENITFAADKDGKLSAQTKTCNVVAYDGTTKTTPTVGTVTGAPNGMTVTVGTAADHEIPITIAIAADATLGGPGEQNGVLSVPVTAPVATSLQIQWSKVNTGATGQSAVVFTVYAPNGTVFLNQTGTLLLATQAYKGSAPITSGATYQWAKYTSGEWVNITGAESATYEVDGSDVVSEGSFRCTMTYESQNYADTITMVDKTDNYQATIDSTGGEIFKNTVGSTFLVCRLWQSGQETDTQWCKDMSTSAPSNPAEGDLYYTNASGTAVTKLMRYNGSAWVDVTADEQYAYKKTYTWYRRDNDGNPLDSGNAFAAGKVIYVDGSSVDGKTVFVCEVS